uniref:Uncharacterized protein n=1 Tax=Zea mays TaxID=4577 RepID=A0A804QBY9_MAIZE
MYHHMRRRRFVHRHACMSRTPAAYATESRHDKDGSTCWTPFQFLPFFVDYSKVSS